MKKLVDIAFFIAMIVYIIFVAFLFLHAYFDSNKDVVPNDSRFVCERIIE